MKSALLFLLLITPQLGFASSITDTMSGTLLSSTYAFQANCWTCGYILEVIELFSTVSLNLYQTLSLPMIELLFIILALWIVYKIISGFFGLSIATSESLVKTLAPKLFATIIVVPLLLLPTPKFVYAYMIEPLIDLGSNYGTKAMSILALDKTSFYCLKEYSESTDTTTAESVFSASFRQQIVCQVSQSHELNALGTSLGIFLIEQSYEPKNRYLDKIPNPLMLLSGLIMFAAYFAALIMFPILLIGALFTFGFILSFLPLIMISFVLTRSGGDVGTSKINFLSSTFSSALTLTIQTSLMLMFLPFMLSISHVIFTTTLESKLVGYDEILTLVKSGSTTGLLEKLSFGSKTMLMLTFVALINAMLIGQAKTIAGWFKIQYDEGEKLWNWTYDQAKKTTQKLKGYYEKFTEKKK